VPGLGSGASAPAEVAGTALSWVVLAVLDLVGFGSELATFPPQVVVIALVLLCLFWLLVGLVTGLPARLLGAPVEAVVKLAALMALCALFGASWCRPPWPGSPTSASPGPRCWSPRPRCSCSTSTRTGRRPRATG
jgi:hypothetical protein